MREKFMGAVSQLVRDESGQDLIEYALLAALIALAAVVMMRAVGTAINGKFTDISTELK